MQVWNSLVFLGVTSVLMLRLVPRVSSYAFNRNQLIQWLILVTIEFLVCTGKDSSQSSEETSLFWLFQDNRVLLPFCFPFVFSQQNPFCSFTYIFSSINSLPTVKALKCTLPIFINSISSTGKKFSGKC